MRSLFIILVILISYFVIVSLSLESLLGFQDEMQAELVEELVKNSIIVILAIVVIKQLRLTQVTGVNATLVPSHWYLLLIPFYLILVGLSQIKELDFSQTPTESILLLLFSMLSVGFSEEFVFRGLMQSLFLKMFFERGITSAAVFRAVFFPALIFGSFHLLDFSVKKAWLEIAQFFYASFIGIGFGAILLRTGSLIPLAIIHGLIDFVFKLDELVIRNQEVNSSFGIAVVLILLTLPMLFTGLLITKKIQPSEIAIQ